MGKMHSKSNFFICKYLESRSNRIQSEAYDNFSHFYQPFKVYQHGERMSWKVPDVPVGNETIWDKTEI